MKTVILVLVVVFYKTALAREDLLENIRVSKANEPELNDFLRSVLRHKEDFRWIRNSVDRIRLQQLNRNLNDALDPDEAMEEYKPAYSNYDKANRRNGEENLFFETKSKRRRGLPYQYSKYRRPINDVYPYIHLNEPRYKRSYEYYKDDDVQSFNEDNDNDNSNVQILTRSDAGVRDMPGVKIQRHHRSECLGDHDSHEYIPPKEDKTNKKKNNTSIMGEYYYSTPHDLLGMGQDLKCEESGAHNQTCVKDKKSIWGINQSHVRRRDSDSKDDRSIKVNIVDKGKLIKTVEQNENSNSLVLTFKDESDEEKAASKDLASDIPVPTASNVLSNIPAVFNNAGSSVANVSTSNLTENSTNGIRPMTAFRRIEMSNTTDDTLENIDKILRHDQDSLKNSSYLPAYLKVKKEVLDDEEPNLLPSKIHKQETRMIKEDDFMPEKNFMVVRNQPRFNDDVFDEGKYQQSEDYDVGYAEEPNYNPEQSRSDGNDGQYEYKPIVYRANQNIRNGLSREKLLKDQSYGAFREKTFKNRRAHKHRYRDSDMDDSRQYHDRRMRNQHTGRRNSKSDTKILPNGIEETITQDPPLNKKNLLEDETEPTSAAEQRELERKDNAKFGSPSMDSFTTEKMLVIPLKKTYRGKPSDIEESDSKYSNLEEYDDYNVNLIDLGDKPEVGDKKFHVKDSRDMIHVKMQKSHLYNDDEEAINNEQIKHSDLEASVSNNKHIAQDKLVNTRSSDSRRIAKSFENEDFLADTPNSKKNHNFVENESINRREALENPADEEDEYENAVIDEDAKQLDSAVKFHSRHILSIPENKDLLPQFDADLDYQNGISNAVNIRVKRTESFDDVDDRESDDDDDDDSAEYSNLGPQWHYEKKRVIKPKDIIPVDRLAIGAEDTLGLSVIPTCVNKRMDQDVEEIKLENNDPAQNLKVGYIANETFKLKASAEKNDQSKPLKTDSHNDGNFEINEKPKDMVETKLNTKEDNEFRNYTKLVRNTNSTMKNKVKLKLSDDESVDHENDVIKYRKDQKEKQKHLHKNVPHSLLQENENVRKNFMEFGFKKHNSHNHKSKFKIKKIKGNVAGSTNTDNRRDIESLNKDINNSPSIAYDIGQRDMRQNLVYDDSTDLPESNEKVVESSCACNNNKQDDRNELQIIEKDQAIIFKFTTPKAELDITKGSSKYDNKIESSESGESEASGASGPSESNKEYCDSGEEIDNPDPGAGGSEEEQNAEDSSQASQCNPVLSIIRNVNGTFDSDSLDRAFGQKTKPVDLSDDAELFDKISNLMAKYKIPQKGRNVAGDEIFDSFPIFIKNRSFSFDDNDIVNVNHHLHKDSKLHPPKSKLYICTKAPKQDDTDEDRDSFSHDDYANNDLSDKDVDKNTLDKNNNPPHSIQLLISNNKNMSFHDLDSVESFSDVVEKQSKAKRTKKQIIDDDILPSDFENLTQVEEEIDSGKPTVRKKRYLKFLYKNSSKLASVKCRRDLNSEYLQDDFIKRGKRRLNDIDMNDNYGDYGSMDYDNSEPKYSRASENENKPNQQNLYLVPNMQIIPNNMRFVQSNQNLQSIQNMRNRFDTAKRYNLVKKYAVGANNKTNISTVHLEESYPGITNFSGSVSHHHSLKNSSKTNSTKMYSKKNENLKEIMNGHLIMDIIDKFTQKLKTNDALYKKFGKRIPRKRAELIVSKISDYRDQQSKKDIKHAEIMLHQVIIMLNRVVMDQVQRKVCMTLAPDLRSYLSMITSNTCKGGKMASQIAEGYPLPELRGGNGTIAANQPPPPDEDQGDFLFESDIGGKDSKYNSSNKDIDSFATSSKKIHLIKKLLHKYENMSASCQVKVEPVKDYLLEHMEMLERIKDKDLSEAMETTTELNDSCEEENPKPKKMHGAAPGTKNSGGNSDFLKNSGSSTVREMSDINGMSTLSQHSSPTLSPHLSLPESPLANTINDGSIKVQARDATSYYPFNSSKSDSQDAYLDDDAKEVEAAKQKFIRTYGHGRIYPLSSRYSDPITHFQSDLSRESSYKEPYIKESNSFNLNSDNRQNYMSSFDMNPYMEDNRMIMNHLPRNQQGNQMQMHEPERNSMMLDALQNPIPVADNPRNSQARKQRRSVNSTYWRGSDKYQKLVEAATELRRKRDIEERIGKLFGRRNAKYKKAYEYRSDKDHDSYPDLSKVQFETPIIYRVV